MHASPQLQRFPLHLQSLGALPHPSDEQQLSLGRSAWSPKASLRLLGPQRAELGRIVTFVPSSRNWFWRIDEGEGKDDATAEMRVSMVLMSAGRVKFLLHPKQLHKRGIPNVFRVRLQPVKGYRKAPMVWLRTMSKSLGSCHARLLPRRLPWEHCRARGNLGSYSSRHKCSLNMRVNMDSVLIIMRHHASNLGFGGTRARVLTGHHDHVVWDAELLTNAGIALAIDERVKRGKSFPPLALRLFGLDVVAHELTQVAMSRTREDVVGRRKSGQSRAIA